MTSTIISLGRWRRLIGRRASASEAKAVTRACSPGIGLMFGMAKTLQCRLVWWIVELRSDKV